MKQLFPSVMFIRYLRPNQVSVVMPVVKFICMDNANRENIKITYPSIHNNFAYIIIVNSAIKLQFPLKPFFTHISYGTDLPIFIIDLNLYRLNIIRTSGNL